MGKELDVRWYDEVLDKFWYPIDDITLFEEDRYVFSLGMDFDSYELVANVFEVNENGSYGEHRVLTKKDYYTGFIIDNKKLYTNDILYRTVTMNFIGSNIKPFDIHDWAIPEYKPEYGGFYTGERKLAFELGRNYTEGFKCTHYKIAGNVHQHSHMFELWSENGGKI